jgi:hypothetical protein
MDAITSLDRAVVWRFVEPPPKELERFSCRLAADRSTRRSIPPVQPFLVVTPAGMREADELRRALVVRGATVVERRSIADWPRLASVTSPRRPEREEILRAYAVEQVWRGLFPRASAELWLLDGERSFERLHAWKPALHQVTRGVQVTVQLLYDSFVTHLPAFHAPAPCDLDREWRALNALLPA